MTAFEELVNRHEVEDKKAQWKIYTAGASTLLFFAAMLISFLIFKRPFAWLSIGFFVSAITTSLLLNYDVKRISKNIQELEDSIVDEMTDKFSALTPEQIDEVIKLYEQQANSNVQATPVT